MFGNIVTAVRSRVAGWGRIVGDVIRKLTKPSSSKATVAVSAAVDATRTKLELVAQNALLPTAHRAPPLRRPSANKG